MRLDSRYLLSAKHRREAPAAAITKGRHRAIIATGVYSRATSFAAIALEVRPLPSQDATPALCEVRSRPPRLPRD